MKARHRLLSKRSLITQFVFRCVLARERLAATRRTPPGWILLRKIWNCRAESLFSQVSITVPFSSLFCPTQAQLAPSVAASAPAWGLCPPGPPTSACTIYTSSVQSFIDVKVLELRFKALNSCAQIYLKDPPWSPYVLNCQRGQNWQLAQPAGDVTLSLWR